MVGTDGGTADGTGGGALGGAGRGALGGAGGGALAVDTAQLEEGAERLARARAGLLDAAAGLERLPVVAVATGADALLDALADLGRQWLAHLDRATGDAGRLAADLRAGAAAYALAEREAAAVPTGLRPLLGGPVLGPPQPDEPVLGPPLPDEPVLGPPPPGGPVLGPPLPGGQVP